jgi:RES domain-containing protein
VSLPPVRLVRRYDTHRLVPARHGETVLARIADDDAHLQDIFEIDAATNDRILAENNLLPGVRPHELVFGVPYFRIVNASFCHASPVGGRFNGPDRGAWYAAFEAETAQAEVAFHKSIELVETGWLDETIVYDDYLSDVSADLHDLRGDRSHADCLEPDSYVASQRLAGQLLDAGSLGVVYPSVRRRAGTNIACFRPAVVGNVRKADSYELTWASGEGPAIRRVAAPRRKAARKPRG